MTQRSTTDTAWYRAITESTADRIAAAIAVSAWVALTALFAAAGSILVVTGTTAATHTGTIASPVLALAGVLGATSASPILAEATVRETVNGVKTVLETTTSTAIEDDWEASSYEASDETYRQSCCA
jgi:hypothetical protein